jgi:lysophospholipase L1-like esterase
MRVAAKAIFSRILLVLFGLGLSLVVMEGVLRVGARFVGGESAVHSAWLGKWRLLAVGDSNTYGLYVDKSQAYPQVFESLWNAMPGTALGPVDVLNLGFPSTNSSKLAKDFRRMLWMFRPDVVTVMIGVNDRWTLPETAAQSPNRLDRLAAWLWKRARAYRFLYMVRQAFRSRHLEVAYDPSNTVDHGRGTARYGQDELELGWREIPRGGVPGLQPGVELQKDLQSVAAQAAEFGARLVFLTYAGDSGFYAWANDGIRAAAKATATPLIDVAAALKPACPLPAGTDRLDAPAPTCPELFPDQHPTVLGHKRIAQILTQQLLPALQEAR